jgi:hypothetical protein
MAWPVGAHHQHRLGRPAKTQPCWRQLKHQRRNPNNVVAVAIARELAGFCWEIALADEHPPDNKWWVAGRSRTPAVAHNGSVLGL